ncbi:MAG: hypothetical protein RJA81_2004, partial [Planctomycetota bacterium]
MNTSSESQPVEKVIIAAGPVEEIPTSHKEFNSDSHAAQWRMTSVRLTGLGGFL